MIWSSSFGGSVHSIQAGGSGAAGVHAFCRWRFRAVVVILQCCSHGRTRLIDLRRAASLYMFAV